MSVPGRTVGWTYVPRFALRNCMGGSINTYVQDVTYTAFFQVAQEEGGTSSNAYITNTYNPNTSRPFKATTTSVSRPTAVPSSSTTAQPSRSDGAHFLRDPETGRLCALGGLRVWPSGRLRTRALLNSPNSDSG